MTSNDREISLAAALALVRTEPDKPQVIAILRRAVEDEDKGGQRDARSAVEALIKTRSKRHALPAVIRWLKERDQDDILAIGYKAYLAWYIGGNPKEVLPHLEWHLGKQKDPAEKVLVAAAVLGLDEGHRRARMILSNSVAILTELFDSPYSLPAADALRRLGPVARDSLPLLRHQLEDAERLTDSLKHASKNVEEGSRQPSANVRPK